MAGSHLLDTNIVIAIFAQDASVTQGVFQSDAIFIPSIVLGELYYGSQKSGRKKENLQRVDEFTAASVILFCDSDTARQYGIVKHGLRLKGKPVPENDLWIAALAMQHGLRLVSRDAHFGDIDGLDIETW